MIETVSKVAFYDVDSKEFYVSSNSLNEVKFGQLSRASFYIKDRAETINFFNYVKQFSNRNVIVVDVEIQYNAVVNSESNAFNNRIHKLQNEYEKLSIQAEADIDAMSERSFNRWKKLRRELKEYGI